MSKKKTYFACGEKGNVNIMGDSSIRTAQFAKETLFAIEHENPDQTSMASIHTEKSSDRVYFTEDGNPFYGGCTVLKTKAEAVDHAEAKGFSFDDKAKENFLAS